MAWRDFNENLGTIGDVLRQQVAKKQMWEDAQRKGQMDLDFAIKKAQAEAAMDPEKQFFGSILNQGTSSGMPTTENTPIVPVQTGGMPDKSMLIRGLIAKKFGVPFENLMTPEERQQQNMIEREKEQSKTMGVVPTSEAGRVALAEESLKNIDDVMTRLFPSGESSSYRRDIATGSNIPLSGLPIIPSNIGFKNPQDVFRKMSAALSARQLIQTGVAARPEETLKLVRQFAPSGLMSAESALSGLKELKDFYSNYLRIVKTKGQVSADQWAKQNSPSPQSGVKEEDIQFTMKKHNLTREEVLKRIGK